MKLIDIQYVLEDWSPISNAEDFDNVGLLVGDPSAIIEKALITLDTTQNILDEAIDQNCNLIITFHPFLYKGDESLKSEEYVDEIIFKALKHNINIYAIHTNLDNNPKGVSFQIAIRLGLNNLESIHHLQVDAQLNLTYLDKFFLGLMRILAHRF